jgi:hypothetical protein
MQKYSVNIRKEKVESLKVLELLAILEKKASIKQQKHSALVIQKYFRGYKTRKHFKNVVNLRLLAAEVICLLSVGHPALLEELCKVQIYEKG